MSSTPTAFPSIFLSCHPSVLWYSPFRGVVLICATLAQSFSLEPLSCGILHSLKLSLTVILTVIPFPLSLKPAHPVLVFRSIGCLQFIPENLPDSSCFPVT